MVGGKVAAEAASVTAEPVLCSAWLDVAGFIGDSPKWKSKGAAAKERPM
jgi:hypothetical protein